MRCFPLPVVVFVPVLFQCMPVFHLFVPRCVLKFAFLPHSSPVHSLLFAFHILYLALLLRFFKTFLPLCVFCLGPLLITLITLFDIMLDLHFSWYFLLKFKLVLDILIIYCSTLDGLDG